MFTWTKLALEPKWLRESVNNFDALDARGSGRGGSGGSLLSLPENMDLGSTRSSVHSSM